MGVFDKMQGILGYISGSRILNLFISDEKGFEGGLVIHFEKDYKDGLFIMGYSEMENGFIFLNMMINSLLMIIILMLSERFLRRLDLCLIF